MSSTSASTSTHSGQAETGKDMVTRIVEQMPVKEGKRQLKDGYLWAVVVSETVRLTPPDFEPGSNLRPPLAPDEISSTSVRLVPLPSDFAAAPCAELKHYKEDQWVEMLADAEKNKREGRKDFYIDIPFTERLGFPLKLAHWPWDACPDHYNYTVHSLLIDGNIEGSTFGWWTHMPVWGDTLLVRKDGKSTSNFEVELLIDYLHEVIHPLIPVAGQPLPSHQVKKQMDRKRALMMTPEAFHTFCQESIRQRIINLPHWIGVDSPVTKTCPDVAPACGSCYAKGEAGSPLKSCAKCKARYYCSKECQKGDWKEHKLSCGIAELCKQRENWDQTAWQDAKKKSGYIK